MDGRVGKTIIFLNQKKSDFLKSDFFKIFGL